MLEVFKIIIMAAISWQLVHIKFAISDYVYLDTSVKRIEARDKRWKDTFAEE
jgi:hypothetical protein